jgi:hypothetical protein
MLNLIDKEANKLLELVKEVHLIKERKRRTLLPD